MACARRSLFEEGNNRERRRQEKDWMQSAYRCFSWLFYDHIIHLNRKNFSRVKEKTKEEEDRNSMKRRLIIYYFYFIIIIIIDTMIRYTISSCKIRNNYF
jgi:hypothetical protein